MTESMKRITARNVSRIDARKFFKSYGAVSYAYLRHTERRWPTSTERVLFREIEYYLDAEGNEIGYFCEPTSSYLVTGVSWGDHLDYVEYNL